MPATDRFALRYNGHTNGIAGPLGGPAVKAEVVDLSAADWTPAVDIPQFLNIGVAGVIKYDTLDGQTAVLSTVVAGTFWQRVTKVYKVGTTATTITAHT